MEAAKRCSDVIWKRGLLKKGYGLCHGVCGNAYAFLAMYKETGDARYLQKAKRFCNFACDYGSSGCSTPDRPYSLFEGMSGTVYFLDDMEKILENAEENIQETYFPCYYVSGYFKEWNELDNTFDCWIINKQLTLTRVNLNKVETSWNIPPQHQTMGTKAPTK